MFLLSPAQEDILAPEHGHPSTVLGKRNTQKVRRRLEHPREPKESGKPQKTNPKTSPGGKTHCLTGYQHLAIRDPGGSARGFHLSPHHPGRLGRGQRCPLSLCALAASAAPPSTTPLRQICWASPQHGPSLGRGDVGHMRILGQCPLPDPRRQGKM